MDDGKVRERVRLARGTAPRAIAGGVDQDAEATRPVTQPTSRPAVAQTDPPTSDHPATAAEQAAMAGDEPARTINEAIERLILDHERDDAVAEWARARA